MARSALSLLLVLAVLSATVHAVGYDIGRTYQNTTSHVEKYGPFTVQPMAMTEFPGNDDMIEAPIIPESYFGGQRLGIVAVNFALVDENDNVYDQTVYLHHFSQYTSQYKNNVFCPQWGSIDMVTATAAQYTPAILPYPYAILLDAGTTFSGYSEVMNYLSTPATFYIRVEYIYVPWTDDLLPVRGVFFDVTSCEGDADYDVPYNPTAERNYRYLDFPSPFTGTLVTALGHVHRGGQNIYLANKDTGEVLANGRAHYDDPNHPDWVTHYDLTFPLVQINMHDRLRLVSIYDNQQHDAVMGTIFGYVHVTEQVPGTEPLMQVAGTVNPFTLGDSDNATHNNDVDWIIVLIVSNIVTVVVALFAVAAIFIYQNRHRFMPPTMIIDRS